MSKANIAIVVVHYQTDADTVECLRSLRKARHPGLSVQTVVVDNGSPKRLKLPQDFRRARNFELIRSNSNLGFTGGNNLGIHYAIEKYNSEYILLLNNDTLVKPDFLEKLYQFFQDYPEAGLASPKIYFAPGYEFHKNSYSRAQRGRVLWYAGGSLDWQHLVLFHRGVDELDRQHFDHQTTSDFATGCCLMIKREVLEKIGTLDKKFFLYLEDADFSLRARRAGYEVGFCSQSVVWHKNAGSSGGAGSRLHEYYQTRNRLLFAFSHGDWRVWWTALRLIGQWLWQGDEVYRQAVWHALTGQYGKQPI